MEQERRQPLTDEDVQRIANVVADRVHEAFYIDEEKHYNQHQRLDALLKVYEDARNIFWKGFLGLVILGAIFLAGVGIVKGVK